MVQCGDFLLWRLPYAQSASQVAAAAAHAGIASSYQLDLLQRWLLHGAEQAVRAVIAQRPTCSGNDSAAAAAVGNVEVEHDDIQQQRAAARGTGPLLAPVSAAVSIMPMYRYCSKGGVYQTDLAKFNATFARAASLGAAAPLQLPPSTQTNNNNIYHHQKQ